MKTVYEYIKEEEAAYKTTSVPVQDGYEWNMYEHVRKSTLYRDSKFTQGANDGSRPNKNIVRRIVGLQHYATGFDVKEVEPFVNSSDKYYMSLLTRKFYPKWARKNNIDTFIDETVEGYVDFGLALTKHVNAIAPENVALQSIAFCDQTDILSGPICLRHQYSPAQLKEFEGKWGDAANGATTTIDRLITLARKETRDQAGKITQAPGKFIEVYELDGMFPKAWLKKAVQTVTEADETTYSQQMHIIAFYKDDKGDKQGLSLFSGKGDPKKYKAMKRDPVFGRACGFGGIEELFEAQVWTNYGEIRIQQMLDAAAKTLHQTADATFASRNNISDAENGEIFVHADGKALERLDTQPVNIQYLQTAVEKWEQHAQGIGSANDALLGENPTSGTPFALQNLVTQSGKGPHEYRKGKIATYFGEIHRDWILDDLVTEMNNEQEFMEDLSLDEMEYVANALAECEWKHYATEKVLNGEDILPDEKVQYQQQVKDAWHKTGTKTFFKLLKNELKGLPVEVDFNIAGKQKNLSLVADKLTNIFRFVFSNPQGFVQTMQIPGMANAFNDILESSGISPVNFGGKMPDFQPPAAPGQPAASSPQPQPLTA